MAHHSQVIDSMVYRRPKVAIAALALTGFLALSGVLACYSPTLPLPPPARDGITLSAPDEDGFVVIIGDPGVMDYGEQAVIINRSSHYGWIIPVDEEGGFEAIVIADPGDVLSIQRRLGDEVGQSIDVMVPEE